MFLYAVMLSVTDDSMLAWQYRVLVRGERDNTDDGHYFINRNTISGEDMRPRINREVYWVSSKNEAEHLARKLATDFPGNTYVIATVGGIYKAEVRDVTVSNHIEGQGILPV